MAAKKNGHDPATTAIVEALGRIEKRLENVEGEARATNQRLEAMAEDLAAVRADVSSLKNEVTSLRAETRAELTLLREDHAARITRLEAAVFRKTGS